MITLSKLAELFPEEKIETDRIEAIKVVEKYGDEMMFELQKRLDEDEPSQGKR